MSKCLTMHVNSNHKYNGLTDAMGDRQKCIAYTALHGKNCMHMLLTAIFCTQVHMLNTQSKSKLQITHICSPHLPTRLLINQSVSQSIFYYAKRQHNE